MNRPKVAAGAMTHRGPTIMIGGDFKPFVPVDVRTKHPGRPA
ncbi:hypothetical protein ACCQ05_19510 [Xanthomonas sp. NCPPB 3582]